MQWIYKTNEDNSARFVLGQIFNSSGKTLLCFGVNPSTATPECLDNTIRKVIQISKKNNYENWIMLNIYPQRATNPGDLHLEQDKNLSNLNYLHIAEILKTYINSDILFAYGNLISKRQYLKPCLNEIMPLFQGKKVKVIKTTKENNPIHPLYQSNESPLIDYII